MEEDIVGDNSVNISSKKFLICTYMYIHICPTNATAPHTSTGNEMHIIETNKAGFDLVSCRAVAFFLQETDEGRAKLLQTTLPTH
jgi:hypothetical protein